MVSHTQDKTPYKKRVIIPDEKEILDYLGEVNNLGELQNAIVLDSPSSVCLARFKSVYLFIKPSKYFAEVEQELRATQVCRLLGLPVRPREPFEWVLSESFSDFIGQYFSSYDLEESFGCLYIGSCVDYISNAAYLSIRSWISNHLSARRGWAATFAARMIMFDKLLGGDKTRLDQILFKKVTNIPRFKEFIITGLRNTDFTRNKSTSIEEFLTYLRSWHGKQHHKQSLESQRIFREELKEIIAKFFENRKKLEKIEGYDWHQAFKRLKASNRLYDLAKGQKERPIRLDRWRELNV